MKPVRSLVFDFDGLLADSEPLQIRAWETFLARYGKRLEPSLLSEMFGLRVRDSSILIREELELPLTAAEVMGQRDDVFLDLVERELSLFPGARRLIDDLKTRYQVSLALATSGHQRYVSLALRVTGLTNAFDTVVTGDDVKRGKPHPDIYLEAALRLNVEPLDCVALEDAPHGVRAAKSAGMSCLAVPNTMTRELGGFGIADAVLSDLCEVVPWLRHNRLLVAE